MPQNDPGFWEITATAFATAASLISAWAWKHTHGLIGKKAEAAVLEGLLARVDRSLAEHREDNQRIFNRIDEVVKSHSEFSQRCIEELGKRPTRDECRVIWHREDLQR